MNKSEVIKSVKGVFNGSKLADILKDDDLEERYPGLKFGKIFINSHEYEEDIDLGKMYISFYIDAEVEVLDCTGENRAKREHVMKNRALLNIGHIKNKITIFGVDEVEERMDLPGILLCEADYE